MMVPNKSILYKENKIVFKNWPLPPLSFVFSLEQENEQHFGGLRQHFLHRNRRQDHIPVFMEDEGSGDENLALDDDLDHEDQPDDSRGSSHMSEEVSNSMPEEEEEEGTSWVTSDSNNQVSSSLESRSSSYSSQSRQESSHQSQQSNEWTDEEDLEDDEPEQQSESNQNMEQEDDDLDPDNDDEDDDNDDDEEVVDDSVSMDIEINEAERSS